MTAYYMELVAAERRKLVEERALADDLADVLRRFFPMSHDGTYEVERVLARYRGARR